MRERRTIGEYVVHIQQHVRDPLTASAISAIALLYYGGADAEDVVAFLDTRGDTALLVLAEREIRNAATAVFDGVSEREIAARLAARLRSPTPNEPEEE